MKLFFKILGCTVLTALLALYLGIVFYLPYALDLNTLKPEIQKVAKEQAGVDVNFQNLHIITDPLLRVGVMAENISVKLPDGSDLFNSNYIKGKVSLPNLLLLTVKVVGVEIDSPFINLEVADGEQLKVLQFVEDMINNQKQKTAQKTEIPSSEKVSFDPSIIKIKVPDVKISDYKVLIKDIKNRHCLSLLGEELKLGYNNGKTFKVRTYAEIYSDKQKNITANISLDTFIPPAAELDEDDDEAERVEMPRLNPVQMYRDYDLKSNLNMKLKARNSEKRGLRLGGYLNVDNISMVISGYELPKSYARMKFRGKIADVDTNLYITPNQNLRLKGLLSYVGKPFMNLNIASSKIYFNDVIVLAKAFADTLNIKNDLHLIKGKGYLTANANIKTNFKKLKSKGAIVVRDGAVLNDNIGLGLTDINANLLFNNNTFKIVDTHMYINNSVLNIKGDINEKNVADIGIYAEQLPLPQLFRAFAPSDLKKTFDLTSGGLGVDIKILGELKNALATVKLTLQDFVMSDKKNTLVVEDKEAEIDLASDFKNITGKVVNNNFKLSLPPSKSTISDELLTVYIDEENITIEPTDIKINSGSGIELSGSVFNYMKNPQIAIDAIGKLVASDLSQFAHPFGEIFLNSSGAIPVKLAFDGNAKRQHLVFQAMADKINHLTPINIQSLMGKQSIIQAKVDFKGNRLRVKDTGLFVKNTPTVFSNDFVANMQGAEEVLGLSTTITSIDKGVPFINLLKITMPKELSGSIYAFPNSKFFINGNMAVFGNIISPRTRGKFTIHGVSIPDLYTTLQNLELNFLGKRLVIDMDGLNLNGSDIAVDTTVELEPANVVNISNLSVLSRNIDLDKLMQVSDAAMKFVPQTPPSNTVASEPANIPVHIRRGNIDLRQVKTGDIVAHNTSGHIALRNNIFYLNNLATTVFGGSVNGNVSANLISMLVHLNLHGANFDMERTLFELMKMKDTLSGTLAFDTDLSIDGGASDQLAQMKSLDGTVDFVIEKGQLGPFGRLENLILAENIRESEFFKTTIGSVINSITSVDTTHFNELSGHLLFNEGILSVEPITSMGDIMCLHIGGTMNLLNNEADMKLRGKLGSTVSNMLGPLAAVNPINLVKVTPGMDILAAKAFQFFCEEITQEEMDAIPDFGKDFNEMSTTKFQVVLRGDTTKPLSLIKSFKWLALASEIQQAQGFVSALPDPEPTPEQIEATRDAERLENKFWRFIYRFRPDKRDMLNE